MKTSRTLSQNPIPTKMMISGNSATVGAAYMAATSGCRNQPSLVDQPARIAIGRPAMIARMSPTANSLKLTSA